jgi:hypothetical protein
VAIPTLYGAKIRALRRKEGLTQAELAARLQVSPSYVNLVENNRRPLSANLLLKLAREFSLDLSDFAGGDDSRLAADLGEAFGDPVFGGAGVDKAELIELSTSMPHAANAVLTLYRAYIRAKQSVSTLSQKLSVEGDPGLAATPTEEINDLVQRRGNYFGDLEEAAESLWKRAGLRAGEIYPRLIEFLAATYNIETRLIRATEGTTMRRYDPERKLIELSEVLPPRTRRFQLAHQVGLIALSETLDAMVDAEELSSPEARALLRVVLANYFAAAVLMPYDSILRAAGDVRYDLELLAHRYQTSFEQVCHRLTTLRRPGAEAIPLHFIRIDIAGNITKRFSASGMRLPKFSGACPRWNVHDAFSTPGIFRIQRARMADCEVYFCVARTVQRASGGYHQPHVVHSIGVGCEISHARQIVYADGVDLDNLDGATPVGVTCRTCEQRDCEQRVFPSLAQPLNIDENLRGRAFYGKAD